MPKDEQLAHQFLFERQPCEHQKQDRAVHFYLRPSQHKFEVPLNHKVQCKLEIVKYAAPIEACINRQLINIVDQVNLLLKENFSTFFTIFQVFRLPLIKDKEHTNGSLIGSIHSWIWRWKGSTISWPMNGWRVESWLLSLLFWTIAEYDQFLWWPSLFSDECYEPRPALLCTNFVRGLLCQCPAI